MNKQDLPQHSPTHLGTRARALEAAARKTASIATDEEHKARSKYETISLETSYLALALFKKRAGDTIRFNGRTLRIQPVS